jgi:glycosyltransferase involved in cell wall biosynthesis
MRVAIKAAQIAEGGGLTHLNKIIEWFGKLAPEHEFSLLGRSGQELLFIEPPANFEYHFYRLPALNIGAQLWWERNILPGLLNKLKADLLFEPGNRGTLTSPCPKVSLVHNMAPFEDEYIREETPYRKLRMSVLRKATFASLQASDGIIFISNYSRRYFENALDLSDKKTAVIYHGSLEDHNRVFKSETIRRLGISGRYLLSVSHIYRYKKIMELVQAYVRCLETSDDIPMLVIAGKDYTPEYTAEIKKYISLRGHEDKILFTGGVSESDLISLYQGCRAFLFPSAIEACPNILIEAMSAGCAIGCSNRGVMPEISDGAALYFDPDNIDDFAAKIRYLVDDNSLCAYLRQNALKRAEFFSWEKTARQTLAFFSELLENTNAYNAEYSSVEA